MHSIRPLNPIHQTVNQGRGGWSLKCAGVECFAQPWLSNPIPYSLNLKHSTRRVMHSEVTGGKQADHKEMGSEKPVFKEEGEETPLYTLLDMDRAPNLHPPKPRERPNCENFIPDKIRKPKLSPTTLNSEPSKSGGHSSEGAKDDKPIKYWYDTRGKDSGADADPPKGFSGCGTTMWAGSERWA